MGVISKFVGLVNKKSQIQHTGLIKILTKHGMFQAKMYKHKDQEYLVILSLNFFKTKAPIFYIHTDEHECDSLEDFCGCSYPISVALKMIHKDGGLILYASRDHKDIDALLHVINVKKLSADNTITTDTNIKSALKGYRGEYLTIDFIIKNLKMSNVQLISNNPTIIFIMQQRGINIVNQASAISFGYGDNKPYSVNEIIEAAKAITFDYGNKNPLKI